MTRFLKPLHPIMAAADVSYFRTDELPNDEAVFGLSLASRNFT